MGQVCICMVSILDRTEDGVLSDELESVDAMPMDEIITAMGKVKIRRVKNV